MLGKNQKSSHPQMGHVQLHITTVQYNASGKTENKRLSVRFKLAVRGDTGAGGLVAPLPYSAYFGKLAVLFGCSLPQQALA